MIRKHQDMCQFYITLYELDFEFEFIWSRNWKHFQFFFLSYTQNNTHNPNLAWKYSLVEGRTLTTTNELCRVSVTVKFKIVTQFISRYAWESSSRLFRNPMRSKLTKNVQVPHLASSTRLANCFQWNLSKQRNSDLLTFLHRIESPSTSQTSAGLDHDTTKKMQQRSTKELRLTTWEEIATSQSTTDDSESMTQSPQ